MRLLLSYVLLTIAIACALQQKRVVQRRRRGRRVNIWGVQEPKVRCDYALMVGTLKTPVHLQLMDWQASIAYHHWQSTGQFTIIVLIMLLLTSVKHRNNASRGGFLKVCSCFSCRPIARK